MTHAISRFHFMITKIMLATVKGCLPEHRRMMTEWADYLDELREGVRNKERPLK